MINHLFQKSNLYLSPKLVGSNPSQSQYSASSSSVAAAAAAAAEGANSMFYYPTSSDLAMYGSSSYGNRTLQSTSRPKSKNRSNAGKKIENVHAKFSY